MSREREFGCSFLGDLPGDPALPTDPVAAELWPWLGSYLDPVGENAHGLVLKSVTRDTYSRYD